MSAPFYQQINQLNLYAMAGGSPGPDNYWIGYLPGASANFGSVVYPNSTWNDEGGVYLFLNQTPGSFSDFLNSLNSFLSRLSPQGDVRMLWIENPNDLWAQWQWNFLKASATQSGGGLNWTVALQALFNLGNYTLSVEAGTAMTLDDTFDTAIAFATGGVTFLSSTGVNPAQGYEAKIELYGETAGAFQVYLNVTDFSGLGAMIRYGALAEPSANNPYGGVEILDMPVFTVPQNTTLQLKLCFDPLNPKVPDRNNLSFFPYSSSDPPALNAAFVTTLGSGTTLKPLYPLAPLRPARLVLNYTPTTGASSQSIYHYTPDGSFHLEVLNPPVGQPINLMLGLSGIEYLSLNSSKAICHFEAGKPAYVGASPLPDNSYPADIASLISSEGTTAHLCILPEQSAQPGFVYFAQPNSASLFKTEAGTNFLNFHSDMPVVTMPSYTTGTTTPPNTYAAGCYALVASSQFNLAQKLESLALAPFRRYHIGKTGTPPATVHTATAATAAPMQAYTKSGLLATLTPDGKSWQSVTIAQMPPGPTTTISAGSNGTSLPQATINVASAADFPEEGGLQIQLSDGSTTFVGYTGKTPASFTGCSGGSGTLALSNAVTTPTQITIPVGPKFQSVLQSNQVFFVASNAATFQSDSPISDQLNIDIAGWNFQLGPANWRPASSGSPTIMIFKFCSSSLGQMAGDTRKWSWPEAAMQNGSLAATLNALQPFLQKPDSNALSDDPLVVFYNDIVNNPNWNGFLFLNATVPLNALPPQLEGLAAGIDPALFFAHHVGVNLSPLKTPGTAGGQPTPNPSSFFGYINYEAPADAASVLPSGDYDFQVDTLQVVFENSLISSFHSKIQVTLNKLFGEYCTSANNNLANNIFLNGTYQHHNNQSTYIFSSHGDTLYNINSPTLQSADIATAQFVTIVPKGGLGSTVNCRFIFTGNLCFQTLNQVDLFSYSSLPFDGLWLDMSFNTDYPLASRSFTFDTSALTFRKQGAQLHQDANGSSGACFVSQFPIKLTGLVYNPGSGSAADKGFLSLNMPDRFSGVGNEYYALLYDLSLGTMGGLAPKKAFTAQLMLCWEPQPGYVVPSDPSTADYPAELKMQLPFAGDGKDFLNIEGVIKLGIEGIELLAADNAYAIKLKDFGLHVLSITLPPSGSTDIYLFGDPKGGSSALGWYAAYNKQVSYAQDPYNSNS